MVKVLFAVGSGGFFGSVLRYLVYRYFETGSFSGFPWGTLAVNMIGSLLAGFLFGLSDKTNLIPHSLNLFLMVGFCGGFTTFSAFALENIKLYQNGAFSITFLYLAITILMGLASIFAGIYLSNLLIK